MTAACGQRGCATSGCISRDPTRRRGLSARCGGERKARGRCRQNLRTRTRAPHLPLLRYALRRQAVFGIRSRPPTPQPLVTRSPLATALARRGQPAPQLVAMLLSLTQQVAVTAPRVATISMSPALFLRSRARRGGACCCPQRRSMMASFLCFTRESATRGADPSQYRRRGFVGVRRCRSGRLICRRVAAPTDLPLLWQPGAVALTKPLTLNPEA